MLGLRKISFGRGGDAGGVELDDALIGLAAALRLDGDRHGAVAGQRVERDRLGQRGEPLGIDAAEAAQADRRVAFRAEIIGGDEIHRAVGLGLHREAAVELQRGAEDRGQRQSFADGARGRLGQRMGRERAAGSGFEAHEAAAQADIGQVERQDEVRGRGVGVGFGGHGFPIWDRGAGIQMARPARGKSLPERAFRQASSWTTRPASGGLSAANHKHLRVRLGLRL